MQEHDFFSTCFRIYPATLLVCIRYMCSAKLLNKIQSMIASEFFFWSIVHVLLWTRRRPHKSILVQPYVWWHQGFPGVFMLAQVHTSICKTLHEKITDAVMHMVTLRRFSLQCFVNGHMENLEGEENVNELKANSTYTVLRLYNIQTWKMEQLWIPNVSSPLWKPDNLELHIVGKNWMSRLEFQKHFNGNELW